MSLHARFDPLLLEDRSAHVSLQVGTEALGLLRRDIAEWIATQLDGLGLSERFSIEREAGALVRLCVADPTQHALDEPFARLAKALFDAGFLPAWRNELYAVRGSDGQRLFAVERGAVDVLGLPARGTHLNAYVERPEGLALWVARRSRTKPTFPGEWDHLAAGGLPDGLEPRANMVKEAAEEAGVPAAMLHDMREVGQLAYTMALPWGVRQDLVNVYDVVLPATFQPQPFDGEVEAFALWSVAEVLAALRGDAPFKFNVGPAILLSLWRRGLLAHDPEASALERALARHAPPGNLTTYEQTSSPDGSVRLGR